MMNGTGTGPGMTYWRALHQTQLPSLPATETGTRNNVVHRRSRIRRLEVESHLRDPGDDWRYRTN